MVITATTIAELLAVNQRVHDLWIDLDLITHGASNQMKIDLFRDATQSCNKVGTLTVESVTGMEIEDLQGIGRYDLNKIEYDIKKGRLFLCTNIPTRFSISVSDLRLHLSLAES